jgi:hypothetical protein
LEIHFPGGIRGGASRQIIYSMDSPQAAEDLPTLQANAIFVLKAMMEKWRRDKKRNGFCGINGWAVDKGHGTVVRDRFFADWMTRLTPGGFRQCVEGLAALGLVQLFGDGAFSMFYEITEKAQRVLDNSHLLAAPPL